MTSGLRESKWAQQPKRRTPAQQLTEDKDRAGRLLRRLYWKAEGLLCSWNRALDAIKRHSSEKPDQPHSTIIDYASLQDRNTVQSMFKLDFFEFYVLLERYIVLCLEILGVRVLRKDLNGTKSSYNSAAPSTFGMHQFHANLLATLDDLECPLHGALGQQNVRIYLGIAKDYRNRWKDADEISGGPDDTIDGEGGKGTLEDLNLATMLKTILGGLEQASVVVKQCQPNGYTAPLVPKGGDSHKGTLGVGRRNSLSNEFDDDPMEDAPWEAVEDAMDWE